jgi:hypothetical protein
MQHPKRKLLSGVRTMTWYPGWTAGRMYVWGEIITVEFNRKHTSQKRGFSCVLVSFPPEPTAAIPVPLAGS